MPSSFNGIGTTYYGRREFRSDATYVTTEWFILFYIPIIPLGSFRVEFDGAMWRMFGSVQHYSVYEQTSLNWRQVLNTYLSVVFSVSWVGLMVWLFWVFDSIMPKGDPFPRKIGFIAACILPWFIPKFLARRAIRKAGLRITK